MATITQDMGFRLSLIIYADKYGVTKAVVKYKTNRQYIYCWKCGMTAPWNLCVTSPEGHTTIQTSIPRKKSSPFPICADAILTPVLSFSGLSSCSAAIPVPFPDCTVSSKSRALWLSIPLTPSISPNPMNRWAIPDSVSRWM